MPKYPVAKFQKGYVDAYYLFLVDAGPNNGPAFRGVLIPTASKVLMGSDAYKNFLQKNSVGGDVKISMRNLKSGKQHDLYVPRADVEERKDLPVNQVTLSGMALKPTCSTKGLANPSPEIEVVRGGCYLP